MVREKSFVKWSVWWIKMGSRWLWRFKTNWAWTCLVCSRTKLLWRKNLSLESIIWEELPKDQIFLKFRFKVWTFAIVPHWTQNVGKWIDESLRFGKWNHTRDIGEALLERDLRMGVEAFWERRWELMVDASAIAIANLFGVLANLHKKMLSNILWLRQRLPFSFFFC